MKAAFYLPLFLVNFYAAGADAPFGNDMRHQLLRQYFHDYELMIRPEQQQPARLLPDSIVWKSGKNERSTKSAFRYDDNGNELQNIFYYWDATHNTWHPASSGEKFYDDEGNLVMQIYAAWDKEDNTWQRERMNKYSFEGRLCTEYTGCAWNAAKGMWMKNKKQEYFYDENGRMKAGIDYYWNADASAWEKSWKVECGYDDWGNETVHVLYLWMKNGWVKDGMAESRRRGSDGKLNAYLIYLWDESAGAWQPAAKDEYSYGGGLNVITSCSWSDADESWVEKSKYEYEYEEHNNLKAYTVYSWAASENSWMKTIKHEYGYDADGNKTLDVSFLWNALNNEWRGSIKYEYSCKRSGRPDASLVYYWDDAADDWAVSKKGMFFYSPTFAGSVLVERE